MKYHAEPGKIIPTWLGPRYFAEIRRVSDDGIGSHHKWWVGPTDKSQLDNFIAALNGRQHEHQNPGPLCSRPCRGIGAP